MDEKKRTDEYSKFVANGKKLLVLKEAGLEYKSLPIYNSEALKEAIRRKQELGGFSDYTNSNLKTAEFYLQRLVSASKNSSSQSLSKKIEEQRLHLKRIKANIAYTKWRIKEFNSNPYYYGFGPSPDIMNNPQEVYDKYK